MLLTASLLIASASCANAWTPPLSTSLISRRHFRTSLFVGQGWDNDDFLNSLSGSSSERERSTEDYYAQSRFGKDLQNMPPPPPDDDDIPLDGSGTKGATITAEMKQRIKEQNEADESQGGQMFKSLLAKAQEKQQQRSQTSSTFDVGPNNLPSRMTVEPYQPPARQAAPQPASISPDALAGLSVEQQAELFRQMIAGNQQQASSAASTTLPSRNTNTLGTFPQAYPPQGAPVAADGRRVGRNRDADQIQNSADLYFAQLKRDSAIRKEAWLAGDQDRANAVFADPSIAEIEQRINPFLEERKRMENVGNNAIETSADEMITPEMLAPARPQVPMDYSGISYKEKMRQLREKKQGGGTASASSTASDNAAAPSAPREAPAAPKPQTMQPAVEAALPPPAPAKAAAPPTQSTPKQNPTPSNAAPPSEEDKRSDIRTLMGLLLKHRGGPGFGAGRLKGDEVNLFSNLSEILVQVLNEEGVSIPAAVAATEAAPSTMGQGAGGATTAKVNSLISVLEGAITMYKNSPEELQKSVLGILRAALSSAVSTLDEVLGNEDGKGEAMGTTSEASSDERVRSMIACIEAACQVYKNSPPELQQPILVTLRAAFVSALNTLGGIMADNEQQVQVRPAASQPATSSAPAPTSANYSGKDENTQFFESVYSKLQAAAGNDKLGLRKGLSGSDATDLADSIAEMRARLVDELENGIPE